MHTKEEKMQAFGRFLDVLDALRANCPWDKKQTNESLRPNTIEETYELCDALIKNDIPDICKELGDVLLHICFYAKIAEEQEQFDMADVCNALTRKMITLTQRIPNRCLMCQVLLILLVRLASLV